METPSLKVLVTGATGQQGGAVARALLDRGHRVVGLTRNPASPAAQSLAELGAQVVAGDFSDPASLEAAVADVDAIYAMGTPFESGVEAEIAQASAIADAAKKSGTRHLVYSSVANADQNTGIPHFDSKYQVEEHIQQLGTPYTIIAPAFFFENFLSPFTLPGLQQGNLAQALPGDRNLQAIALGDIASFAVHVIENRDDFLGRRIDIAGDELTGQEYADSISRASGRSIGFVETPLDEMRAWSEDMASMFDWFNHTGYNTDIDALRHNHPQVSWHTFAQWADLQDWSVLNQTEETHQSRS